MEPMTKSNDMHHTMIAGDHQKKWPGTCDMAYVGLVPQPTEFKSGGEAILTYDIRHVSHSNQFCYLKG